MDNPAGVFQVQAILEKKLSTSGLLGNVEIDVEVNGKTLVLSQVKRLWKVERAEPIDEPVTMMKE
jgi:metal-dependent HD superfamily phosphatase/phosphodiesterase